MVIECIYKQEGKCRCSAQKETIDEMQLRTGWICGKTCPLKVSRYTDDDWARYMRECLVKTKNEDVSGLCLLLFYNGHKANYEDDEFAIMYDACTIRLIQIHERKYLSGVEYCSAYEIAKRLGVRLPMRSDRIYKRLKKKYFPFYKAIGD